MHDVAIVGGGLAGLVSSILLSKEGFSVLLFEEKEYPFHRVCGEYISNEVIPFLSKHELFPEELEPAKLTQFKLTSTKGRTLEMPLDLGGFGVSRFQFDFWLVKKARNIGVAIHEKERVTNIDFEDERFAISTSESSYIAKVVIGAYGKRTKLDNQLNRPFFKKRSPYIGVKYHIKTDLVQEDHIELHNFNGGYCGTSKIENDTFNVCYLSHRNNLRKSGSILSLEESILYQNPFLERLFKSSEFLFEKPEVINEISFERKEPVVDHILMAGDSAGMITPLCGNGMAMAIHASKLTSELVGLFLKGKIQRVDLESNYENVWNSHFAKRHWAGRQIQKLFGAPVASELGVVLGNGFRPFAKYLMSLTHGSPFS